MASSQPRAVVQAVQSVLAKPDKLAMRKPIGFRGVRRVLLAAREAARLLTTVRDRDLLILCAINEISIGEWENIGDAVEVLGALGDSAIQPTLDGFTPQVVPGSVPPLSVLAALGKLAKILPEGFAPHCSEIISLLLPSLGLMRADNLRTEACAALCGFATSLSTASDENRRGAEALVRSVMELLQGAWLNVRDASLRLLVARTLGELGTCIGEGSTTIAPVLQKLITMLHGFCKKVNDPNALGAAEILYLVYQSAAIGGLIDETLATTQVTSLLPLVHTSLSASTTSHDTSDSLRCHYELLRSCTVIACAQPDATCQMLIARLEDRHIDTRHAAYVILRHLASRLIDEWSQHRSVVVGGMLIACKQETVAKNKVAAAQCVTALASAGYLSEIGGYELAAFLIKGTTDENAEFRELCGRSVQLTNSGQEKEHILWPQLLEHMTEYGMDTALQVLSKSTLTLLKRRNESGNGIGLNLDGNPRRVSHLFMRLVGLLYTADELPSRTANELIELFGIIGESGELTLCSGECPWSEHVADLKKAFLDSKESSDTTSAHVNENVWRRSVVAVLKDITGKSGDSFARHAGDAVLASFGDDRLTENDRIPLQRLMGPLAAGVDGRLASSWVNETYQFLNNDNEGETTAFSLSCGDVAAVHTDIALEVIHTMEREAYESKVVTDTRSGGFWGRKAPVQTIATAKANLAACFALCYGAIALQCPVSLLQARLQTHMLPALASDRLGRSASGSDGHIVEKALSIATRQMMVAVSRLDDEIVNGIASHAANLVEQLFDYLRGHLIEGTKDTGKEDGGGAPPMTPANTRNRGSSSARSKIEEVSPVCVLDLPDSPVQQQREEQHEFDGTSFALPSSNVLSISDQPGVVAVIEEVLLAVTTAVPVAGSVLNNAVESRILDAAFTVLLIESENSENFSDETEDASIQRVMNGVRQVMYALYKQARRRDVSREISTQAAIGSLWHVIATRLHPYLHCDSSVRTRARAWEILQHLIKTAVSSDDDDASAEPVGLVVPLGSLLAGSLSRSCDHSVRTRTAAVRSIGRLAQLIAATASHRCSSKKFDKSTILTELEGFCCSLVNVENNSDQLVECQQSALESLSALLAPMLWVNRSSRDGLQLCRSAASLLRCAESTVACAAVVVLMSASKSYHSQLGKIKADDDSGSDLASLMVSALRGANVAVCDRARTGGLNALRMLVETHGAHNSKSIKPFVELILEEEAIAERESNTAVIHKAFQNLGSSKVVGDILTNALLEVILESKLFSFACYSEPSEEGSEEESRWRQDSASRALVAMMKTPKGAPTAMRSPGKCRGKTLSAVLVRCWFASKSSDFHRVDEATDLIRFYLAACCSVRNGDTADDESLQKTIDDIKVDSENNETATVSLINAAFRCGGDAFMVDAFESAKLLLKRPLQLFREIAACIVAAVARFSSDDLATEVIDALSMAATDEGEQVRRYSFQGLGSLPPTILEKHLGSVLACLSGGVSDTMSSVAEAALNGIKLSLNNSPLDKVMETAQPLALLTRIRSEFTSYDSIIRSASLDTFSGVVERLHSPERSKDRVEVDLNPSTSSSSCPSGLTDILYDSIPVISLLVNDEDTTVRATAKSAMRSVCHCLGDDAPGLSKLVHKAGFDQDKRLQYNPMLSNLAKILAQEHREQMQGHLRTALQMSRSGALLEENAMLLTSSLLACQGEHSSREAVTEFTRELIHRLETSSKASSRAAAADSLQLILESF